MRPPGGRARRAREVAGGRHPVYVRPYDVALVHMGLHDHDAALEQLEKAFEDGGNWLNYVRLDPAFAGLRDHPRFAALLRRLAETGNTPA